MPERILHTCGWFKWHLCTFTSFFCVIGYIMVLHQSQITCRLITGPNSITNIESGHMKRRNHFMYGLRSGNLRKKPNAGCLILTRIPNGYLSSKTMPSFFCPILQLIPAESLCSGSFCYCGLRARIGHSPRQVGPIHTFIRSSYSCR
jgi:hypothetical protein